jgi:hypothetical protein
MPAHENMEDCEHFFLVNLLVIVSGRNTLREHNLSVYIHRPIPFALLASQAKLNVTRES